MYYCAACADLGITWGVVVLFLLSVCVCVSVVRCWGLHVEMFCVLLMGWTVCAVRSSDCVWVMIAFFCCFFFSQKWVSVILHFSPQPYLLYLECIVLLLFLCVDLLLLIHCNSFFIFVIQHFMVRLWRLSYTHGLF